MITLDDIFPPPNVVVAETRASDGELRDVVSEANWALQRLQAMVGREERQAAKITFPRGYLRELGRWRTALRFVRNAQVRDSVADTLMMHDVQTWVLKRTDLAGHARDMIVKGAIGVLGSVAEAVLIDATSPPMGQRQRFASRLTRLCAEGVIAKNLAEDLEWLWDIRNRQHLHALAAREFDVYTSDDHPRAESVVATLIQSLQAGRRAPFV